MSAQVASTSKNKGGYDDYVHLMCLRVANKPLAPWLIEPVTNRYHLRLSNLETPGKPIFACIGGAPCDFQPLCRHAEDTNR